MQGTIKITFYQDEFKVGPNYRPQVLEAMLNYTAEFYLAFKPYGEAKAAILLGFPDVEAPKNGNVDLFFFTLYSECFTNSFQGALELIERCWKWILNDEPDLFTDQVMEAAQLFHEYGVADAATFASTYGHFFEAALDEHLYAPNYACLMACEAAGFDLVKWANYEDDRLAWLGYFPPAEVIEKAS